MVALSANSALVAGSAAAADMKTQTVKVLRSFLYQGRPLAVGSVVEVPSATAGELFAMGKAVKCDPLPPKPSPRPPRIEVKKDETT